LKLLLSIFSIILMTYLLFVVLVFFTSFNVLFSQSKGESQNENSLQDSVFIFTSVRPLLGDSVTVNNEIFHFIELSLSDNGYGFGYYLTKNINSILTVTGSVFFSGARNTDELEYYDPFNGHFFIPNKINRLYMLPVTFGARLNLFPEELSKDFQPFVQASIGGNFILSNPYSLGFLEAWNEASVYIRPVFSLGFGSSFSNRIRPLEISVRYQYSPFGGEGLESILRNPISNFGGLYIALGISI